MRLDEKDMQPKSLKGKTFGKTIQEYRLRNGWTQGRRMNCRGEQVSTEPTLVGLNGMSVSQRFQRLNVLRMHSGFRDSHSWNSSKRQLLRLASVLKQRRKLVWHSVIWNSSSS